MTAATLPELYARARHERGTLVPTPARAALQVARYRASQPDWRGLTPTGHAPYEARNVATGILQGFTVAVSTAADSDGLDFLGDFTPARERFGERVARPDPSAVLFTSHAWSLGPGDFWYTPTESIGELVTWYSRGGASRGVAYELALADIKARARSDAEELDAGAYVVTVTVSRHGVELGDDSLGGVTFSHDDWELELADILPDMIEPALDRARATLATLCAPDSAAVAS